VRPRAAGRLPRLESALERQGKAPLLRPGLWTDPAFRLGVAMYLVFFSAVVPFFLYYSITLQYGLGYGAFATAAAMAPYALGSTITSLCSARIVARFTALRTLLAGCVICAAGSAFMIITMGLSGSGRRLGAAMTPAMLFTGLGLGLVIGPLLNFVLARFHAQIVGNGEIDPDEPFPPFHRDDLKGQAPHESRDRDGARRNLVEHLLPRRQGA
jgi:predicted MFS family arabinose efflux permease